ncbi:flagellar hook-associated protein FlgK [Planktomarina temperata]|nr:flagellar hook-associated protein FlgK [Planktomarina temperata]
MGDLFDIGKAGISAYKNSLAATGQNIANVGTEGYARRDASIEEISVANADILSISNTSGLGVRMGGITRAFDQFLDLQLQNSSSSFAFAKSKAEILDRLETVLIPQNATVGTRISEFFDGLSNLAQDPSDLNLRTLALTGAEGVSRAFVNLSGGLSDLRSLTQDTLNLAVGEFNSTLKDLSIVQNQILGNANKKGAPNILLDQRDTLLSKLSEFADISVEYHHNGGVTVSLGQLGAIGTLLEGNFSNEIEFDLSAQGTKAHLIGVNGNRSSVHFTSGQLAGLISADSLVGTTASDVNALAQKFCSELNTIHKSGLDLNGDRGGDLFSLKNVEIIQASGNTGQSSLSVIGYSEDFAGSEIKMTFNADRSAWAVMSSNGKPVDDFNSYLDLDGLTVDVQGTPKDGDQFYLKINENNALNMTILISDGNKFAAAGLHTSEASENNSGNSDLKIGYFNETFSTDNSNLENLFSESRNAANPIRFNSTGALGVIKNVDSVDEMTILRSQASLRIFTDITKLSASDQLTLELGNNEHKFNIGSVFSSLGSTNDLAEILNEGAILSNGSPKKSFSDLGLHAVASGTSFLISSASQLNNSDFDELKSGSLGTTAGITTAGMLVPQDVGKSSMGVFTREGIQISGEILSQDEVIELITTENGFSREAVYRPNYIPTVSNVGFSGVNVDRKTTSGLDVVSLSGAGFKNNVSVYVANSFPSTRTQLNAPISVSTGNGHNTNVVFESGMMAGHIAAHLSTELADLGIGAAASNLLELSGIADGLLEFELFGNNTDGKQISVTIANSSNVGLVNQINSFSEATGITAYLSGDTGIVLEHLDAGDITLKNVNLTNGSPIAVNQLDQFGERMLTPSKSLADGEHLVIGGNVQLKSTSDFTVGYDDEPLSSTNSAFEMGFAKKVFDLENDHTDIDFYANYNLDGDYADAKNINAVSSASKYSVTLSDTVSGNLVGSVRPQTAEDFSTSVISKQLAANLRDQAPSTIFVGDAFGLIDGFPDHGSKIEFSLGNQKYIATLNVDEEIQVQGLNVTVGAETFSGSDAVSALIAGSSFSVAGPEEDRLEIKFEAIDDGLRLTAIANNGVVSGHGLAFSTTNASQVASDFHISDAAQTVIYSKYFPEDNDSNVEVFAVMVGDTEYQISFDTTDNSISLHPDTLDKPDWMSFSIEPDDLDDTQIRMKIAVNYDVARDSNIRLKSNSISSNYGISTVSAQLSVINGGLRISNVADQRVKSSVAVNSLATEVLSIDGMRGEDLIFISQGDRNPTAVGRIFTTSEKALREYSMTVNTADPSKLDIYDLPSGHIVGTRSIVNDNSTFFQGLSLELEGAPAAGDTFKILVSGKNADDANNLNNMLDTSLLNRENGVGGYSDAFGKIISNTGAEIQANQQTLETTDAAYQMALDNKNELTGVDLDTEAARLMEQQQAYQALARVLTTARELLDTLLRSM